MTTYIVHLGADALTTDGRDLAGCIMHFARLEDAARLCTFVRSVASERSDHHDLLGHAFKEAKA